MADSTRHYTLEESAQALNDGCIPEPNSGCLIWMGAAHQGTGFRRSLYGGIRVERKMWKTHRFAYRLRHGVIPPGLQIMHTCDVSLCCNPDHLVAGTNDQNHADKARRDRGAKKLTAAKAATIREMAAAGLLTYTGIAKQFGVAQSTVSRIVNGQRRQHAS